MKLDTVIDDIVESYQKHNDISKVDTIRQPDKTIIIDILERLQDYFSRLLWKKRS